MITAKAKTSDGIIWNIADVYSDISYAMSKNLPLTIDFLLEGPDFHTTDLPDFIKKQSARYGYDQKITLRTCNMLEKDDDLNVEISFPRHLIANTFEYETSVVKNKNLKHFGLFVGRGNAPRLLLSSYLYNNYKNLVLHTNHFNRAREFYVSNIGFDRLVSNYDVADLSSVARYLELCPVNTNGIEIDKSLDRNPAQQLLDIDRNNFLRNYDNFFVEIVCETFYSGETFFPTEKIWRPIFLFTPFIVQGPPGFLKHLRKLGFQTFERWWDEGYDQDPQSWSIIEICRLIDRLSTISVQELNDMYIDMLPVLQHNRRRLLELNNEKFNNVF